ncbi:hypothetical protein [Candidatus Berkiella aquae]|uniref:Internalin-J n=1 Tax=Candidatus Berkiella aquae TaxID=295108 RepID=A0A0Q9Z009_9GAMM|nr:hypothetical protein [Candidatus Berkiella aquae]MCS5710477.1 hypothetical protein [Candidatus Berkiella aquae]
MQQGPLNEKTSIDDELWAEALAYLPPRDMVNFRLAGRTTNRSGIIRRYWQIKSEKQDEEIKFLLKSKSKLIDEYEYNSTNPSLVSGLFEEPLRDGDTELAELFEELSQIESDSTETGYLLKEKLLDDINMLIIQSCIKPLRNTLEINPHSITRFPRQLFEVIALQDYWKRLERLYLSHNKVRSLELNQCESLQYLECDNNRLELLNINQCTKLRYLKCQSNSLPSLNVENCRALSQVNCSNNKLTALAINGKNLAHLYCENNELSSLELDCPLLFSLRCANNNLVKLDLSKCPCIHSVLCDKDKMREFVSSASIEELEKFEATIVPWLMKERDSHQDIATVPSKSGRQYFSVMKRHK